MTDKERLKEIEVKYSTLTVSSEKNSTEYTEVDVKDLVFLIQNGFKQAERVQELEETNKKNYWIAADFKFENLKLEQQNQRYKQALEFYANKINYLTFIENGRSNIEHDQGEKARQALESDEN